MKWEQKSLDELGFVSRGKSKHRPRNAAHLYGGCYPFIQTADVKHSILYINQVKQYYSEAGLAQSKLWSKGTLCITIAANIADTAILGFDACFPDSIIGFVADDTKSDTKYVKYLFSLLQKQYQQFSQGATQDNLSQEKLLSLRFPTPSLPIQQEIASILSAYDDLMENNLRRIELLEQSARELYKEWFVRFKFPGYENVKIVDGLPDGWERKKLGDFFFVKSGYAFKSKDWQEVGNPVIKIKNIVNQTVELNNCQCINDDIAKKAINFKLNENDILIAMSGATVGKIAIMPITQKPYYLNQRVGIFRERTNLLSRFYLFQFLTSTEMNNQIIGLAYGAAQPNISPSQLEYLDVVNPSTKTCTLYNSIVEKMFLQRNVLLNQNQLLKQARELLLPKLMKGEINV